MMQRVSDRNPTHERLGDCLEQILDEAGFSVCRDVLLQDERSGRPLTDADVLAFRGGEAYCFELKSHYGRLDNGKKRHQFEKVFDKGIYFDVFQEGGGIYVVSHDKRLLGLIPGEKEGDKMQYLGLISELEDAA